MTATDRPPSSGMRKKWLILAATVGGAATLGVLFSMRGPSNPAAPVLQPPVVVAPVPPVVGIPVIGIGVPAN